MRCGGTSASKHRRVTMSHVVCMCARAAHRREQCQCIAFVACTAAAAIARTAAPCRYAKGQKALQNFGLEVCHSVRPLAKVAQGVRNRAECHVQNEGPRGSQAYYG